MYEIVKNNNILSIIINKNPIKIDLNIDKYGFFIINLHSNIILYNNVVVYNGNNNTININKYININIEFYNDDSDKNIFNNTDELIFYNIELVEHQSELMYNIYGSYLGIINFDNNNHLNKISEINKLIDSLQNIDLKMGNINMINDFKNKITNVLNNKDLLNIKHFEDYTKNIQNHSKLIFEILNQEKNISIDKYILSIYNSLKIILNCYNDIHNFYNSIQNLSFININDDLVNLTNEIIKLKSYDVFDIYYDIDNNNKKYYISNKLNFLLMYEESIHYFYNGLPIESFNINNIIYIKTYSIDDLLIKKDDYLNLFSIDVDILNNLNSKITLLENNNLDNINDQITNLQNQLNQFNVSNKKLNDLLIVAKNKILK